MEIVNLIWNFFTGIGDSSLLTKTLLVYLVYLKKQQDNRLYEVEDKQEALIWGFKSVPTMNGTFTGAYNDKLKELRESRDRRNKK